MIKYFLAILFWFSLVSPALADATVPIADKKGAKDSPLLKRYEGSFIVAYEHKSFDEFVLPLSKLETLPEIKRLITTIVYTIPNRKMLLKENALELYT